MQYKKANKLEENIWKHITDKGLTSPIYKELLKIEGKKEQKSYCKKKMKRKLEKNNKKNGP